jgi:hypothetical protein
MDIFAHALWTAAGARGANATVLEKNERKLSIAWTAFWGIFPDLFAFGIPMILAIPMFVANGFHFNRSLLSGLPHDLYQYSHSLVIWLAVFLIVWIVRKKPALVLFGWMLHILIDIPSHSGTFYPTPFLFPISDYKYLNGIAWSNMWYMIINYSLLLIVFLSMLIYDYRKQRKQKQAQDYISSK